jgi:hypothetical protein
LADFLKVSRLSVVEFTKEYWIPAEELADFNRNIVGKN